MQEIADLEQPSMLKQHLVYLMQIDDLAKRTFVVSLIGSMFLHIGVEATMRFGKACVIDLMQQFADILHIILIYFDFWIEFLWIAAYENIRIYCRYKPHIHKWLNDLSEFMDLIYSLYEPQ